MAKWKSFFFQRDGYSGMVNNPADWAALRDAFSSTDTELLTAREATYGGNRSFPERQSDPAYGFESWNDGERTLMDFFITNGMLDLLPESGTGKFQNLESITGVAGASGSSEVSKLGQFTGALDGVPSKLVAAVKGRIDELFKQFASDVEVYVVELQEDIEAAREDLETDIYDAIDDGITDYETEFLEKIDDLKEAEDDLQSAESEYSAMENKLEDLEMENCDLKEQILSLKEKIAELENANDSL